MSALARALALLALFGQPAPPALAQDAPPPDAPPDAPTDDEWDFGDTSTPAPAAPSAPSPWSLTGFLRSDEALWVERLADNALAKARQSLDLNLSYKHGPWRMVLGAHGEYDLAYLVSRDTYDAPTLDAYEWLVDVRKTFVALELDAFDVTLGRQIVNWGEGDALSLADLVNPRDFREPGLTDLDDLRLPLLMTRVGWFSGYHRVELMVAHEAFFGYRTPPFGPFSPFPALLAGDSELDLEALLADKDVSFDTREPRFSLENQGYFARWSYKGPGLDFAVFAASTLDWLGTVALPAPESLQNQAIALPLEHRRYHALGLSGARPVQDWLLKWELVLSLDKSYNTRVPDSAVPAVGRVTLSSLGGLLGLQYGGVPDTTIALEMAQTLPFSNREDLFYPLDTPQIALRVSHLTLRQDLRLALALSLLGWRADLGWLARAEASYTLMDGLELGLGVITYQPADALGPLSGLTTHDRVMLELRWDFTLL